MKQRLHVQFSRRDSWLDRLLPSYTLLSLSHPDYEEASDTHSSTSAARRGGSACIAGRDPSEHPSWGQKRKNDF